MRVPLFIRVLPVYMVLAVIFIVPVWQRYQAGQLAVAAGRDAQLRLTASRNAHALLTGDPVRIVLPQVGIDLPIARGAYNAEAEYWTVASTTANYAPDTPRPNNRQGSPLIYGHWTQRVFGATNDLKPGDTAFVYTGNGHVFEYVYEHDMTVVPTDTAIFKQLDGKPGLVLMTCHGTWSQERRLMFFTLKEAS